MSSSCPATTISALPSEIISSILIYLITPTANSDIPFSSLSPQETVTLPPSHATTKLLLSLTLLSRQFYPHASRLLYTHCMYIDTPERLHQLCFSIVTAAGGTISHGKKVRHESRNEFKGNLRDLEAVDEGDDFWKIHRAYFSTSRPNRLPKLEPHLYITSLYLRPFLPFLVSRTKYKTQELLGITHSILDIISLIKPRLRNLIIDFHTSQLHREGRTAQASLFALRTAFSSLPALQSLTSLHDGFALDCTLGSIRGQSAPMLPVWSKYNQLRHLVLYNIFAHDETFWTSLACLPKLETVVLVHLLVGNISHVKDLIRKHVRPVVSSSSSSTFKFTTSSTNSKLTFILLDPTRSNFLFLKDSNLVEEDLQIIVRFLQKPDGSSWTNGIEEDASVRDMVRQKAFSGIDWRDSGRKTSERESQVEKALWRCRNPDSEEGDSEKRRMRMSRFG